MRESSSIDLCSPGAGHIYTRNRAAGPRKPCCIAVDASAALLSSSRLAETLNRHAALCSRFVCSGSVVECIVTTRLEHIHFSVLRHYRTRQ